MTERLKAMVAAVGIFIVGGVSYVVSIRQPTGRPIADLRDAGLVSDRTDRWVLACPEKITVATARYLARNGYGTYKAGSIRRMARVVYQHGAGDIINPSLDAIANEADGGDEDDETDDSNQFRTDDCYRLECDALPSELRLLGDGGFRHQRNDGGEAPWCNSAVRRGLLTPPCVIPDCWESDGGWSDNHAPVDCLATGFMSPNDPAPGWRGCNVMEAVYSVGTACIPVECSVVAGDNAIDVLQ